MDIEQEIKQRLQALAPVRLSLQNDSRLHAGHAGNNGGGHFSLLIVSETFCGQTRLTRQRLVKQRLHDLFPTHIHALSIKAASPDEYFHHNA